jgi:hypothetical protein
MLSGSSFQNTSVYVAEQGKITKGCGGRAGAALPTNKFDVSSISPNATGIEVLSCTFEKLNGFRPLKAIHQIRAVIRSGEYRA